MRTLDILFYLVLASLVLLGALLQTHILLNWDVSWLLHISQKLLAGGTYSNDFFELNPPLILYLYLPAIFFTKLFSISVITGLRCYIFLLGSISLLLCAHGTKKIFAPNKKLAQLFLLSLASVFFIFPVEQFGQREHLLLLLTMPYLLGVIYQLNGHPLSRPQTVLVGILAGFGFGIKPYFLITFVFVELYFLAARQNKFAWVRADVISIVVLLMAYLGLVLVLHRDYLFIVLPLAARLYYTGVSLPCSTLATNPAVFTCYFAIVFHLLRRKESQYAILRTVLFLMLTGFLLSYFLQHTIWFSHLYPAFASAFLLLILEFVIFALQTRLDSYDLICLSLIILFICGVIAYYQSPLRVLLIYHPGLFFSYFAGFFAFALATTSDSKQSLRIVIIVTVILSLSYAFTQLLLASNWYSYRFIPTVFMLLSLFIALAPNHDAQRYHAVATASLGVLLFSYTFYYICYLYDASFIKKAKITPIIQFLHTYAQNKPVDFLASTSFYTYPVLDYADALPTSRFQFVGWVADILKKSRLPNENNDPQLLMDKRFLISMLAADLNSKKPAFILVETWRNKQNIDDKQFDYLNYLLQDANFRAAWQSYRYFTTLSDPSMYQFVVYKHI